MPPTRFYCCRATADNVPSKRNRARVRQYNSMLAAGTIRPYPGRLFPYLQKPRKPFLFDGARSRAPVAWRLATLSRPPFPSHVSIARQTEQRTALHEGFFFSLGGTYGPIDTTFQTLYKHVTRTRRPYNQRTFARRAPAPHWDAAIDIISGTTVVRAWSLKERKRVAKRNTRTNHSSCSADRRLC